MPERKGGWTDNDIAKLKSLAGKLPVRDLAAELGRTPGATAVKAHKLGLFLRSPRSTQSRNSSESRQQSSP
jgi:hypothetical protein